MDLVPALKGKSLRSVKSVSSFSYCCGASVVSEQQHKQDLKRIYRRGYKFSNSSLFTVVTPRHRCVTMNKVVYESLRDVM